MTGPQVFAVAVTGLIGWGFWSAAAILPARHQVTQWCILIGAVLIYGSLASCIALSN